MRFPQQDLSVLVEILYSEKSTNAIGEPVLPYVLIGVIYGETDSLYTN